MKITAADVVYVAALAHLEVPSDLQDGFAAELSRIVDYVEQLNRLDTTRVEPTTQVVGGATSEGRRDRVEPRTGSSEAGTDPGLFRVPRVIADR